MGAAALAGTESDLGAFLLLCPVERPESLSSASPDPAFPLPARAAQPVPEGEDRGLIRHPVAEQGDAGKAAHGGHLQ